MKKIRLFVLLSCLLTGIGIGFAGCSDKDDTGSGSGSSGTDSEYVFVDNVIGYWGSEKGVVSSAHLKLYKRGNSYYVRVGSENKYTPCFRNPEYRSSYTGRDPEKKYKYYAKPFKITYYFDI